MFDKIDVRDIVRDHYRTLVSYRKNTPSLLDYVLFLGLPVVAAGTFAYFKIMFSDAAIMVLITAISILAGLLFNMLVLIQAVAERFAAPQGNERSRRFLKEIYSNISYSILVCILVLIPFVVLETCSRGYIDSVANAVASFLMFHLLLTLLMVLKRLHALLSHDLGP